MTDVVAHRFVAMPAYDAVVTIMRGAVGGHVGILYRRDASGNCAHLHLAGHLRLQNDDAVIPGACWVVPALDELALSDLRASASLIAKRLASKGVPYALRPLDARFDGDGLLQLNQSRGLTCATFVLLVMAHALVTLVDATTWDEDRTSERVRIDESAQATLVAYLRRHDAHHADLLAQEVGCARIRAEEVAAASGMTGHPITFMRAEPQGRRLLELVLAAERTSTSQESGTESTASTD